MNPTIPLGTTRYAAARDGGPWRVVTVQRLYIENYTSAWALAGQGDADHTIRSRTPILFYGDLSDLFETREQAQVECERRQNEYLLKRQRARELEAISEEKRRARDELHERLYAEAMSLAADVDDMDCVEHYCQGHVGRLREFINSRLQTEE